LSGSGGRLSNHYAASAVALPPGLTKRPPPQSRMRFSHLEPSSNLGTVQNYTGADRNPQTFEPKSGSQDRNNSTGFKSGLIILRTTDIPIHIDARMIAASNRNLRSEIAAHRFRNDLFEPLNVMALRVPSLRKRPEDILPLAKRLLLSASTRRCSRALSDSARALSVDLPGQSPTLKGWPGAGAHLASVDQQFAARTDEFGFDRVAAGLMDQFHRDAGASGHPTVAPLGHRGDQRIEIKPLFRELILEATRVLFVHDASKNAVMH